MLQNKRVIYFITLLSFISIFFIPIFSKGDKTDLSKLTIKRIFGSKEFSSERFGPAVWLKKKGTYTLLEPSKSKIGGQDVVEYNAYNEKKKIVVSSARLVPESLSSPLKIENYSWSQNGKKLLIFTNSKRVRRLKTRGDYWVINLTNWKLKKLGGKAKPCTLMFAKFSPDGNKVAYVCDKNLFVEDLESNKIIQLTSDGSKTIINGTFDWVYEEEFHLHDGFSWSPDGNYIAYWQMDTKGLRNFYLINNTDSLYSKIIPIQYPKAGETNSACRIGVVNAKGGKTIWFKAQGDPRNNYIPRMDWAANSKEIIFQHLNRLQNTDKVMLGNARTGDVETILTEVDKAWIEVVNKIYWLDNGRYFTWISERDGWRHVYLVSRSGNQIRLITKGNYDVINVLGIDKKGRWLYFIASPDNPTQRYLYRVPIFRNDKEERLTPINKCGTHFYQISPSLDMAFHTYSSFNEPPVIDLICLPKHKRMKILMDNKELRSKIRRLKRLSVEFFRVDIGNGIKLDAWCMKPYDFNPERRYPVLFYVYGEPWNQTVLDRWSSTRYLWHLMLTQQGYIIMSVDNRGTPAPRGRDWRKCIYRQIGILASSDQARAVNSIIKTKPYVDSQRIGIWGWSGGGSMTLNAMFRYPEIYRTGIAVAPVTNMRYYDTIYQERYMGLPEDNKRGYKNGSPITFAKNLKGNLLVVHGTGDDNVHYQNTEALTNELIKYNKQFSMMSYPNRTHGIYEGKNTRLHLFGLLTMYMKKNLPPGPR